MVRWYGAWAHGAVSGDVGQLAVVVTRQGVLRSAHFTSDKARYVTHGLYICLTVLGQECSQPSWLTTAATLPPHDLLPGGTYLSVTRAGRDGVAGAACADQRGQGEGEAIGDGQDVGCPTPCRAGASLSATRTSRPVRVPGAVRLRRPRSLGRSRWVLVVVLILLVVAGGPCLGTQSPRCRRGQSVRRPSWSVRGQTASSPHQSPDWSVTGGNGRCLACRYP